jgi:hypothetical protein
MKFGLHISLAVAALLPAIRPAMGTSLPFEDLSDVRGPYVGVGAGGEALYVCKLGDAGGWPISAYWSSARTERSPLFGMGWSVPALESRFVQLDERRWAFHQPDGFVRVFVKPKHGDGKTLFGGFAWSATVDGDAARVVADPKDGGPKSEFSFRQGRLVRMTCEEGDFEIRYAGRAAEKIVSRGKTLMEIVRGATPDQKMDIRFNGGKAHVMATCRPVTVFGQQGVSAAVLSSQERCLVELDWVGGRKIPFEYGGENGEAFFSVGRVHWTWDPITRHIRTCGPWTYTIEMPEKSESVEPSFARRHSDGRRESYSNDRKTGLRVEEFSDGSTRASKMFTSGPLAWRRLRWMKETDAAGAKTRTDFAYDEAGRLVYRRAESGEGGQVAEEWYGPDGAVVRRRVDGKEVPLK